VVDFDSGAEGRFHSAMIRRLFIVSLLLGVGCKDEEPAPPPTQEAPATNESPGTATAGDPKPQAAPEKSATVHLSRVAAPKLPPVPQDILYLVIHKANTNCPADGKDCAARADLAAKIVAEIETVENLLAKGTDRQKTALRKALLITLDPIADRLLVDGIVGADGNLDTAVVDAIRLRRTALAVLPLGKYLQKAIGATTPLAIDALGYLGSPQAEQLLVKLLKDERLKPHYGVVCQALSRLLAKDTMDAVSAIADRTGATELQVIGCGGAEAAFRTLEGGGPLAFNVDGKQTKVAKILLHQKASDPLALTMTVSTDAKSSCKAPSPTGLQLRVPLDRDAEAIVGGGLVAELTYDGKALGASGSFLLRFLSLELQTGASARGTIHLAHTRPGEPRIILSGHFGATYCGVGK
jgi:hypothetical protein